MKIISLQAENIKRLVAVEIRPDGNMVQITGKNGMGKTSVLDAIAWAIEGAKDIQAVPIRHGWDRARIKLDLGEIVVTRTFVRKDDGNGYTTSISVTNAEGARYPSPQTMLDKLLGALSFDPLAFSRMKAKEQFEVLKGFVPGVDFDKLDMANRTDYASRTEANKKAKDLKAQATAIAIAVPKDLPDRVDVSELMDQLEAAGRHNSEVEAAKTRLANQYRQIDAHKATEQAAMDKAANYRKMAEDQEAQAKMAAERADTVKNEMESVGAPKLPIDVSTIRAAMTDAKTINDQHDRIDKRAELLAQAAEAEAASLALTHTMAKRETTKQEAIAAAKLPVSGIGFGDGVVLLNGVPFEQASDAEQLRVSVALAMAQNPTLRVIRVRDGSLLDDDSMRIVAEMADAADVQVWIERVDGSGKVGFVLEDGAVRAARTERMQSALADL